MPPRVCCCTCQVLSSTMRDPDHPPPRRYVPLRQTCRQHRSCCANTNHHGIVAPSTPSLLPSQVRRWDYNREVAAVEGKMEGSTIHVMLRHSSDGGGQGGYAFVRRRPISWACIIFETLVFLAGMSTHHRSESSMSVTGQGQAVSPLWSA